MTDSTEDDLGFVSYKDSKRDDVDDLGFTAYKPVSTDIKPEKGEPYWKAAARYAYQIPSGIMQAITYPADLVQMLGVGSAMDEEEMEQLEKIHAQQGKVFDRDKYMQSLQKATEQFPTQSNVERMVEESTGLPLTPKTTGQKMLRLAGSAGKLTPGGVQQKVAGGVAAPVVSESAQALGVPEPLAEMIGLGAGVGIGSKAPTIQSKTKPSGLTEQRYEKIQKPTPVSARKIEKINEKVENEFRGIADRIIEESPISDTRSALKEGPAFKEAATEAFLEVEAIAEDLPNKVPTQKIKKQLVDNVIKEKGTGFLPSEKEKTHKAFIKQFLQETPEGNVSAGDLVRQYRKNNQALKEVFEPGQSFAHNQAKRQALMDYNKAIGDIIESEFPNSEFSNLFKDSNKQWSKIMDAESIDKFLDQLFDGKIQFNKGKDFFEKNGMNLPFKRALGEKGFKDFKQLMTDLMTKEQAHKYLKSSEAKPFLQTAGESALAYVMHPSVGKFKIGYNIAKDVYKSLFEMMIDKPQLIVKWDKGVNALKKGDTKTAGTIFKDLESERKVYDLRNEYFEVLPKQIENKINV